MSRMALRAVLAGWALAVGTLLAGCGYDYLQHSDRVSYSAGDAVKANIAIQTENPSKPSMYSTSGLGKDGEVVSVDEPTSSRPPAASDQR